MQQQQAVDQENKSATNLVRITYVINKISGEEDIKEYLFTTTQDATSWLHEVSALRDDDTRIEIESDPLKLVDWLLSCKRFKDKWGDNYFPNDLQNSFSIARTHLDRLAEIVREQQQTSTTN